MSFLKQFHIVSPFGLSCTMKRARDSSVSDSPDERPSVKKRACEEVKGPPSPSEAVETTEPREGIHQSLNQAAEEAIPMPSEVLSQRRAHDRVAVQSLPSYVLWKIPEENFANP